MKFSVMSRKAKPTARPTIEASAQDRQHDLGQAQGPERQQQPADDQQRADDRADDRPQQDVADERGQQDLGPGREQPRQQRRGRHDGQRQQDQEPLAAQVGPQHRQLPAGELPGRHHLLVGLHLVQDQAHALDPLDDVGDLVPRVVVVDPAPEHDDAVVDVDAQRADAGILGQEPREEPAEDVVRDSLLDADRPGGRGPRRLGLRRGRRSDRRVPWSSGARGAIPAPGPGRSCSLRKPRVKTIAASIAVFIISIPPENKSRRRVGLRRVHLVVGLPPSLIGILRAGAARARGRRIGRASQSTGSAICRPQRFHEDHSAVS